MRDDNNVGNHAILNLEGKMWVGNFGASDNAINSVVYSFKKTSDTEWITGTTTITPTVDNNGNITFTGEIASNNPDYSWDLEASYNVKIVVSDKLSSATVNLILNSAIPTMSLDKNGVGIMCAYDNSLGGLLQVGGRPIDIDIYDENETKTNKIWIGKPIYRKVIDFGALPNNTSKLVNHNINNLGVVVLMTGYCYTSDSTYYPLPLQYKGSDSSYNVELSVNNTSVGMISSKDRSHLSAYVILEYTKTTD